MNIRRGPENLGEVVIFVLMLGLIGLAWPITKYPEDFIWGARVQRLGLMLELMIPVCFIYGPPLSGLATTVFYAVLSGPVIVAAYRNMMSL